MNILGPHNNAGGQPMNNTGGPKRYTPYYILQEMRKHYQNSLHNHESEIEHYGLILTVRAIAPTEFVGMYNDNQWIYQTLNKQMGIDPKIAPTSTTQYYECHVYVEGYSQILPEIDVKALQDFEENMRALSNPQSTQGPTSPPNTKTLKKVQAKAKKPYNSNAKTLEKIKKEYAKCTFHPCCYFATKNASITPQPWQLVQVNIQENSADHFLGRISKIFDKRKPKPSKTKP